MDAAYALAEEPQRQNPLLDLIQVAEEKREPERRVPSERQVAAKNEQSLNMLGQMMKGVQRKR